MLEGRVWGATIALICSKGTEYLPSPIDVIHSETVKSIHKAKTSEEREERFRELETIVEWFEPNTYERMVEEYQELKKTYK